MASTHGITETDHHSTVPYFCFQILTYMHNDITGIFVHMAIKGYVPRLVVCCLELDSKLQKKSPQHEILIFKREKEGNLN